MSGGRQGHIWVRSGRTTEEAEASVASAPWLAGKVEEVR